MFRLATVVATLLFFFSFGINFVGTQLASQAPAAYGMGGGGGDAETYAAQEAPAMEEPAAAAPMAPAPAEPEIAADATNEEPAMSMAAPAGTEVPPSEDATRLMDTPVAKNGDAGNATGQEQFQQVQTEPQKQSQVIPSIWQIGLAVVAVVGLLLMGLMRQLSANRWK